MTFQLDTSGAIERGEAYGGRCFWTDLDPFTQGYVEALFQQLHEEGARSGRYGQLAFSDLAPETLARIVEDCLKMALWNGWSTPEHGRRFWMMRQDGRLESFPPLTPILSDDGKVRFAEAGR